jgi:hypothetical protein
MRFFASLRMTNVSGGRKLERVDGGTASIHSLAKNTNNCHSERNEVKRRISSLI